MSHSFIMGTLDIKQVDQTGVNEARKNPLASYVAKTRDKQPSTPNYTFQMRKVVVCVPLVNSFRPC